STHWSHFFAFSHSYSLLFTSIPLFFSSYLHHRYLLSFPTRRSSDLRSTRPLYFSLTCPCSLLNFLYSLAISVLMRFLTCCFKSQDRKSTRLNSSHVSISYAVFCLKKKKIQYIE